MVCNLKKQDQHDQQHHKQHRILSEKNLDFIQLGTFNHAFGFGKGPHPPGFVRPSQRADQTWLAGKSPT